MVLKLFHSWFPAEDVDFERRLAAAVSSQDLPVPRVGDLVEIDGRAGLEYERIEGPTMAELLRAKPWLVGNVARRLAQLHKQIHQVEDPVGLPVQRDRLLARIGNAPELRPQVKGRLKQRLMSLPMRTCLCHGDFHPGNVILSSRGPVIIDWIDASIGHPGADVGRTLLLLEGEIATSGAGSMPTIALLKLFIRAYLKGYRNHEEGLVDSGLDEWRPILAAARMAEGIDELNPWLLDVVMESEGEGDE